MLYNSILGKNWHTNNRISDENMSDCLLIACSCFSNKKLKYPIIRQILRVTACIQIGI
jgi:hypothetical protein